MLDEITSDLVELRSKLEGRDALRRRVDAAQLQLERERLRLDELESAVQSEALDVERLEGLSLTALLQALVGGREARLEQERQEYVSARLRRDECRAAVEALERETARLRSESADFDAAAACYEQLLAEKGRQLVQEGALGAGRIGELSEQLARSQAEVKEMLEAITAGEEALRGLQEVASSLRSARNLGTIDMLGGGWLATAAKHSKMDDAAAKAAQVQQALRRFQRELADVLGGFPTGFTLDVESFSEFADTFFDGLIVDWMAQSSINRSRENVDEAFGRVRQTLALLEARVEEFQARARQLEEERRAAVERA